MEQMTSENESVDEENVFYFESDHLALRGNKDYSNMLRTIAILEAQKARVHKQIDDLSLAKKHYMENPKEFLKKIQNNEEIIAPNYMTIAQIPEVGSYEFMPEVDIKIKNEPDGLKTDANIVRGRVMDETKPQKFNQLWTLEEQKRLEELLIEYPEERFEMHRFTKIAKALGNRTAQQVSSRVQKYFQKLHSAGMPIPGRIPKNRRFGHKTRHYYRPSTFFPSHIVPVQMSDDDYLFSDLHTPTMDNSSNAVDIKSNMDDIKPNRDSLDNISADIKTEPLTPEVTKQIVNILKMVKQEKQEYPEGYNADPMAAKCITCQFRTISRQQWRCNTCYYSLNLCPDCLVHQIVQKTFEHFSHDVLPAENDSI